MTEFSMTTKKHTHVRRQRNSGSSPRSGDMTMPWCMFTYHMREKIEELATRNNENMEKFPSFELLLQPLCSWCILLLPIWQPNKCHFPSSVPAFLTSLMWALFLPTHRSLPPFEALALTQGPFQFTPCHLCTSL